jgi:hypothetical protein
LTISPPAKIRDGYWGQNFFPDGTPYWTGVQLDETALPVMLAAKLDDLGKPPSAEIIAMIEAAVGYLLRHGPLSPMDRWEEDQGGSPFTLATIVAALVAGARYLDDASSQYALALADDWNERIEEWCYVAGTALDSLFGLDGHYVRIGPDPQHGLARIANQPNPDYRIAASSVLGLEFAYLARLGLRSATDKKITDTATRKTRTAAEQVTAVTARYGGQKPAPSTSHWRSAAPLTGLVAGRDLVVEDTQPFTLHYGFGDPASWTGVTDANSVPLPFEMHGVTLTAGQLNGQTNLNFIRRHGSTWDSAGNQTIPIVASAPKYLQHQSGLLRP